MDHPASTISVIYSAVSDRKQFLPMMIDGLIDDEDGNFVIHSIPNSITLITAASAADEMMVVRQALLDWTGQQCNLSVIASL